MNYAANLKNSIDLSSELQRLEMLFRLDPKSAYETHANPEDLNRLGFQVSTSQFGTYVQLPVNTQYGNH